MSRLKNVSKLVLIVLLALAVCFTLAPNTMPGGTAYAEGIEYTNTTQNNPVDGFPNNYGPIISSDKASYELGENIYIKVENSSSATGGGWIGIYDSSSANPNTTTKCWAYTGNKTVADVTDYVIYGPEKNSGVTVNSELTAGQYYIIHMADDGRWAVLPITITDSDYIEPEISLDKEGSIPQYKYGEPVMLTAQGNDSTAWFGVYDHDNPVFPDGYYVRFNINDVTESIDLVQAAADAGKPLKYGEKYRIYLCILEDGNPNSIQFSKSLKFELVEVYGDPTWQWDENYTTATATFAATHDSSVIKTIEVTGDGITSVVTKEATEEEEGIKTHTATITADMIDFITENDPPFTDSAEEVLPKLSHVHNTEAVAAKEPTCETAGNIAYYECTGCHKYFEDAGATNEIEDKTSVVRPATGHDYGDWEFDGADKKTHTRVCANDSEHVETADCTFVDGEVVDGKRTHTCSVCDGSYTTDVDPIITTDHENYLYGSDIFVTSKLNETTNNGWMAIYYKDQYKDEDSYGQSLIWWYVGDGETTKNIKEITKSVYNQGIGQDYDGTGLPAGDYEAVYLDSGYVRHGAPTYFSVYYEYNDPTWTWEDDGSSATATFAANGKEDATETATDSAPTKVEKTPATCTEDGVDTYTATVTVDFATVSGETSFSDSKDVAAEKLGHSWGNWTEVKPATETEEGLEERECSRCHNTESRAIPVISHTHKLTEHPAAEATCVAAGNTAYWICDQGDNPCGKYFSDEEGTNEIEENTWVIPKTNEHDYGDWEFDGEDKKTHTKTCSRDESHKVTEACTFEDTEEDGVVKHTCSVCGGSYTTPITLSTDKDSYKLSEPIMVTVNYEGDSSAWVGLYGKDETPNPNQNPASIYWYYIDGNSTYDLTKGTKNREYGPGEYKVILFGDGGFTNIIATKNITLTDVGPSDISIDATSYSMGDPVMVTATSDYPNAWVGLYDYDNSDPLDTTLLSYYLLSDSDGEPVDIFNGDIVKDKEKLTNLPAGKYKVILFTSGYDIDYDSQGNLAIRSFELKDNSGCDHDWGEWKTDEESYENPDATKTHTRVCKIDSSHVETKPCTFDNGVDGSDPGTKVYTCTICGGTYEEEVVPNEPVISTNQKEYKFGEEILVTTEMNGYSAKRGWVALYHKGAVYKTSLYWFYPDCFDKTRPLLPTGDIDTNNENYGSDSIKEELKNGLPVGDYELVYLTYPDNPYQLVGQPTYFSVVKDIESEEITKEPTCTEAGNKHVKYKDGTEEDIDIPALGHDPKDEWTYIAEEKAHYHACSRCEEQLDKEDCKFDEGQVTKAPTAKEEGEMTYTCKICGGTYTEAIPTLENQGVKRIYGDTRYETAILQADELKDILGVEKFDAIILATGNNFADALSGSYLGYVKKAPILLVNKGLSADVKKYIQENLKTGGTIYLLGGTAVIPASVEKELSGTKRLSGATRYETNIAILKEAGVKKEELMICSGTNYPDSLSASAAKRPILLVNKALNKTQRNYLDTLRTRDYYIIGGTNALPKALADDIGSNYGTVKRLGGKDRYETSVLIAEEFMKDPEKAVVAYAMKYPDGLCGGTVAAYLDAPLILVTDGGKSAAVDYAKKNGVKSGIVLGGKGLIADDTARAIFDMAAEDEIYVIH